MNAFCRCFFLLVLIGICHAQDPWPVLEKWNQAEPLPGTQLLKMEGDLSLELIERNDRFLGQQITKAVANRNSFWQGDDAVSKNRERLVSMLGLDRDTRAEFHDLTFVEYGESDQVRVRLVKWRVLDGVHGHGILFEPKQESAVKGEVILLPDADDTMEAVLTYAPIRQLAMDGCRVLVPSLVSRENHAKYKMSNREWLQRPAFELGRTLIGYELHQVLSGADWFSSKERPLGITGRGEGGLLAMYAAALDARFVSVSVHGYFGPREALWKEPADRNVFGLLTVFGDAEMARLIHPRSFFVTHQGAAEYAYRADANREPEIRRERASTPGKPGVIPRFDSEDTKQEWSRIEEPYRTNSAVFESSRECHDAFRKSLGLGEAGKGDVPEIRKSYEGPDLFAGRSAEAIAELDRYNQACLVRASADRKVYWKDLDTKTLESFAKTVEPFRDRFRTEVIGEFSTKRKVPAVRTRPFQEGEKTISYEVVLDVMDEVIAYGILTLPKDLDLAGGEKRPVVVCQHGLEGSPQDVVGEPKYRAYKAFATRLAERGFITFAPQNGYKYFDLFRMQQFKSQSIGKTLFSIIVPQHLQITDWLASLSYVDPGKIAFYGLSYGGKSAMRIPPLVERYCLSICSADFNEWVWKNAATDPESLRYSYANKGEYEIFEWNLGGTFNYAEMAALIAPRPFMVERGHFDGVAPDERVGFEFGKVRNLYQARLGIGDRCEIEWFVGPHTINSTGTFQFLEKHLRE